MASRRCYTFWAAINSWQHVCACGALAAVLSAYICALAATSMTTNINPKFCYDSIGVGCRLGRACRLRHDIQKCSCGLVLRTVTMGGHLAGKRHLLLMQTKESELAQKSQTNSQQSSNPSQRPPVVSRIAHVRVPS
jgi:hypothetical protein